MAATLNALEFVEACKEFVAKYSTHESSHELELVREAYSGWTLVEHPVFPSLSYLTRTVAVSAQSRIIAPGTDQELPADVMDLEENDLEETDIPEVPLSIRETKTGPACAATEYVIYAPSFQVPAFYFTISDTNGSPLSLGRLVQTNLFKLDALVGASVHETHIEPRDFTLPQNQERGAVFPLLSQGEHPTLQIPCWYFHPCETGVAVGELLAVGIQNAAERRTLCHWLEAWMAMLGTVVNLRT